MHMSRWALRTIMDGFFFVSTTYHNFTCFAEYVQVGCACTCIYCMTLLYTMFLAMKNMQFSPIENLNFTGVYISFILLIFPPPPLKHGLRVLVRIALKCSSKEYTHYIF